MDTFAFSDLPRIPFSLNQLKELEILGRFDNSDTFLAFTKENRMFERFTFANFTSFEVTSRGQLADDFPALKDISYEGNFDDTKDPLPFALSHFEFRRTFSFVLMILMSRPEQIVVTNGELTVQIKRNCIQTLY